jgi:hypothetical protein
MDVRSRSLPPAGMRVRPHDLDPALWLGVSFGSLRDACSPGLRINTSPISRMPFIAVHT